MPKVSERVNKYEEQEHQILKSAIFRWNQVFKDEEDQPYRRREKSL